MNSIGDAAVMPARAQAIDIVIEWRRGYWATWQRAEMEGRIGEAQRAAGAWDQCNRVIRYLTDPEAVEAEWRAKQT
jgi:hypothetical protein